MADIGQLQQQVSALGQQVATLGHQVAYLKHSLNLAAWVTAGATVVYAALTYVLARKTGAMANETKRQFDILHKPDLQVALYGPEPQTSSGSHASMLFHLINISQAAALRPYVRASWAEGRTASIGEIGESCASVPYTEARGGVILPGQGKRFSLVVLTESGEFTVEWSDAAGKTLTRTWRLYKDPTDDTWGVKPLG